MRAAFLVRCKHPLHSELLMSRHLIFLAILAGVTLTMPRLLLAQTPVTGSDSRPIEWQFSHDPSGRITSITDPGGKRTEVQYESFADDATRIKSVVRRWEGGQVSIELDRFGRRLSMTDAGGKVGYNWNDKGQLERVERAGVSGLRYEWDSLARLKSYEIAECGKVEYEYDYLGRLATMKTPVGNIKYEYLTGQGKVVRTLPNGVKSIWDVEANGRLSKLVHLTRDNHMILEWTYSYRPDDLIARIDERTPAAERSLVYTYDNMQRLTGCAESSGSKWLAEYDAFGNRTSLAGSGLARLTCTFDWASRLRATDGVPCQHDASSNLTHFGLQGVSHEFQFNQDNQIASIEQGNVRYDYAGDGNLITRTAFDQRTQFLPDPLSSYWRPLCARAADGSWRMYVWDNSEPLIVIGPTQWTCYLHDHLGSVRCEVDQKGAVTRHRDYSPIGLEAKPSAARDLVPGFAGLFWDDVAGVYLTRARAYSPGLGRFLQVDPALEVPTGSLSDFVVRYSYCGGDGVNFRDIDGRQRQPEPRTSVDSKLNGYVLDELERNEEQAARDLYGRSSGLDASQRAGARNAAVLKFFEDHASYSVPGIGGYTVNSNPAKFGKIQNKIIDTPLGPVNLDWATTVGHANATSGIPSWVLYGTGKTFWNAWGPLSGQKSFPNPLDLYPAADRNALPWIRALFDANRPLRSIIMPAKGKSDPHLDSPLDHPPKKKPDFYPHSPGGDDGGPGGDEAGVGPRMPRDLSPSPVGGVYLAGAGKAFEGLGQLKGMSLDAKTGRMVLLTEDSSDITLPALRTQDIVAIFRAVNEGCPWVTIDPDPTNPTGDSMLVLHDVATADQYVGWVLFQCDRIMKSYTTSRDNESNQQVRTSVPGYQDIQDKIFFGAEIAENTHPGGSWERFWIVPSAAFRYHSKGEELTLFDVPLKVRTQKMVWRNGKLENDSSGTSSPGATAFTEWFSRNYEGIAREQYLTPPPETEIAEPVPVFSELRRIALITAIAERLRDDGVPMPTWMRDYELQRIPVQRTTKAITVERKKTEGGGVRLGSIYGGVNLSPSSDQVRDFSASTDLRTCTPEDRKKHLAAIAYADALAPDLAREIAAGPMLTPFSVISEGKTIRGIALPGPQSRQLGPCRLDEVDLDVQGPGGLRLSLHRRFNSFFRTSGEWGRCWTMDLPRLGQVKVPTTRTESAVEYKVIHELTSPLGSVHARFSHNAQVPSLGAVLPVPDEPCEVLALARAEEPLITRAETKVMLKDGRTWLFDEAGHLVGEQARPLLTIYNRNGDGTIAQIVGRHGDVVSAIINLTYDNGGRLIAADAENAGGKAHLAYGYAADGVLETVTCGNETVRYGYDGGFVQTIEVSRDRELAHNNAPERQVFTYASNGQLLTHTQPDGIKTTYGINSTRDGYVISAIGNGKDKVGFVANYDEAMRPTAMTAPEGGRTTWTYHDDGSTTIESSESSGVSMRSVVSGDGKVRTSDLPGMSPLTERLDEGGHLASAGFAGEAPFVRQEWNADGSLRRASFEDYEIIPEYDRDGRTTKLTRTKPSAGQATSQWTTAEFDSMGRISRMRDGAGRHLELFHNADHQIIGLVDHRDGKNFGFRMTWNTAQQLAGINSSWGNQANDYGSDGHLRKITFTRGSALATIEFKDDSTTRFTSFDGAQITRDFFADGLFTGFPKSVLTPELNLQYSYSPEGALECVQCGNGSSVSYGYDQQGTLSRVTLSPNRDR